MSINNIEQQYICPTCNYSAYVSGHEYFDVMCNASIGTLNCKSCNRLFDKEISERITQVEIDEQFLSYNPPKEGEENYQENKMLQYFAFQETIKPTRMKKKVSCCWCGSTKNEAWIKENPVCPKCSSKMEETDKEDINIKNAFDFEDLKALMNSAPKVVLCFLEKSCSPCRHASLLIPEVAAEYSNEYSFIYFDDEYDYAYNLTKKYRIKYLPCFLVFENGKFIGKFSNVETKQQLIHKLKMRYDKRNKNTE
jgi:thiol-disulfide isomerase/thioredoxin